MKKIFRVATLIIAVLFSVVMTAHAAAPRQINYQGYLTNPAGAPLTGTYSMVFSLCTAATEGTCPWSETQSVAVDKGIFNVALGSVTALTLAFDVQYYLDIQVGGEQMTARQPLTSVGYAFSADAAAMVGGQTAANVAAAVTQVTNATGANTADTIVKRDSSGNFSAGTITANLTGNAATVTNGVYTNTANTFTTGTQTITTGAGGTVGLSVTGASGQTANLQEWRDLNNTVLASVSPAGTFGVNTSNTPRASLEVGGTDGLLVTGTRDYGTVSALGAGMRMHWYPRKGAFRVGMAETNYWDDDGSLHPNLAFFSIGMGYQPRATGVASTAIGAYNKATGDYSLSLGSYSLASGYSATAIGYGVTASDAYATAIGAGATASGELSLAMGSGADTNYKEGAMVFSDATWDVTYLTAHAKGENSITMRFTGFYGSDRPYAYKFMTGYPEDTSPNVYMLHNDNAWRSSCSRDLKENFTAVDGELILAKIRELPITQWNFKTADPSVKYIGPVAEDFWDAFKLGGADNKGISSIAIEGVNMAGVQALEKRTSTMKSEMAEMKATIELLKAEIERLKAGK